MDSMRSLNTSLPRSSPRRRRRRGQTRSDLLQAFKAAALSVTQLYKTAAVDEDNARSLGYQDALDELLVFLDQENLGLGDGEGWKVRQWATERLLSTGYGSDVEAEKEEVRKSRSPSPVVPRRESHDAPPTAISINSELAQIDTSPPPLIEPAAPQDQGISPANRPDVFQFRSPIILTPTREVEMSSDDSSTATIVNLAPAAQMGLHSRAPRSNANRHVRDRVSTTSTSVLGHGAGAKRKQPFSDFFDISSVSGKDNHGGGKKNRLG